MLHDIFAGRRSVFVPSLEEYKEPRSAWATLSSCFWWTYATAEDEVDPELFQPSRIYHSIALRRLRSNDEWSNVEKVVRCENTDHGTAILLQGTFTCGKYRNRTVEIGIVLEQERDRHKLLSIVRVKTAPWQLLHRRMLEWRSRHQHSQRILECIEKAGLNAGSDVSCDNETTLSIYSGHYDNPWVKLSAFVRDASRSLSNHADKKQKCELEMCISVVDSIAFRLGPFEFKRNVFHDIGRAIFLAYDNLFSLLHLNKALDETLLRDFFEAQDESLHALEAVEVECARRKKMSFPRKTVRSVKSSLGRFYAVLTSLASSCDVADQYAISRSTYGCAWQYNCLARSFDYLVEWELVSEQTDFNKHCLFRECASTTRRILIDHDANYWYVDLIREIASGVIAADELYRECLSETRRLLGEEHVSERLLEILINLAETYEANGLHWEAVELYRESLTVSQKLYGQVDRSEIADIMFIIGRLLDQDPSYDESKTFLLSCYEMRRRLGEEVDGSKLATVLCDLAGVLYKLSSLDEAEERYRECLEIWERFHGVGYDDVEIAYTLRWLAQVMEKKGDLDEARHIFNECLSMRRRLYDEDHYSITEVLFALGRLLTEIGEFDEALLLCRECVDMERRIHGDDLDSSNLPYALHQLAMVHRRKGNFPEASRVLRELFKFLHESMDESTYWWLEEEAWSSSFSTKRIIIRRIKLDPDDTENCLHAALSGYQNVDEECYQSNVVLAMHQLGGFLLRKSGRPGHRVGEKLIRESFSVVKEMSDNDVDHWLVSDDRWFEVCCLQNIAYKYQCNVLSKDAERLLRESLNILREVAGEEKDSLDIAYCLRDIGDQIQTKSRRSEKRYLLRESFEMVLQISGDDAGDFEHVVNALKCLIDFELENGTGENVSSMCLDCLDSARRVHGDGVDHEDILRCFHLLGRIAVKQNDLEVAERWYRMYFDMRQRLDGFNDKSMELDELAHLALKSSRFDDAERLFRELFNWRSSEIECAITFQVLAHSLVDAGKVKDAKRVFLDCLKSYELFEFSKLRHFEDLPLLWWHSEYREPSDGYRHFLNFLELQKILLPNGLLHRGVVVALLLFMKQVPNAKSAERWARNCLSMTDQLFREKGDDPFVSLVYFGLACSIGENDAERLYRTSLEIDRRLHGTNVIHADIAITLYALANLLLKQGMLDEAEQLYREFLKMHKQLYGKQPDIFSVFDRSNEEVAIEIVFELADAYWIQGSSSTAEKLFRECYHLLHQWNIDCSQHVDEAFVLQILASMLLDQGLLDDAKDLFRQSLNLFGSIDISWDLSMSRPRERFFYILSPSDECEKIAYRASFKFHGLLSQAIVPSALRINKMP